MIFEKYLAGQPKNVAYQTLWDMVKDELPEQAHTAVIRRRVSGEFADFCDDYYFVAHDGEKCYSRLWTGWGKHKDSVGNFGHFLTLPESRGQGLGREVLKIWCENIKNNPQKPLALFCTANPEITEIYRPYGFREIVPDKKGGFLYCPLGDSPETFEEFIKNYYQPSDEVYHRPANFEYRHEVDCLLRFAFSFLKDDMTMGEYWYVEEYLVRFPERVGMLFAKDGHLVGWSLDGKIKLHPLYKDSKIIDQR